jgi:NTP pyrophosphatase (non-canonical NTP hydrolase)
MFIMYNVETMDIQTLTKAMEKFVRSKGWNQTESLRPQTAKNLAISLSIEASEVLELFQWIEKEPDPQRLAGELADVTLYLLQLASVSGIDLEKAVLTKLEENYQREWDPKEEDEKEN